MTKTLRLCPSNWRTGDRIVHPDGMRARRALGRSTTVTITAIDRLGTLFQVGFVDGHGGSGQAVYRETDYRYVTRTDPVPA